MKTEFLIFVNDTPLLFKIRGTKKAAQEYIKTFLVSTHMGQWRKIPDGYAYDTTIGKYYKFIRERNNV